MIYVFGNSHSNFFTANHPTAKNTRSEYFTAYNLGPTIAYHFYEHHFPKVRQILTQTPVGSNVLLCVGEVDCRLHLPWQAQIQGRDVYELTEECIDRLFRCQLELKDAGYLVIGWGGHPSTTEPHDMSNPERQIYGDCLSRNNISLFWSDYLQHKCKIHNMPFVSIVRNLIGDGGITKMEYFIDYCHLSSDLLLNEVTELLHQAIQRTTDE